ncbi:MAG: hypothetical protein P9M03_12155 [Candidatus Theseobacter exili]|nr:hypothetical protein [Candidatus Theseobacter exili]
MCALRNKLKRLEELLITQKYENHLVQPYSSLELWQKVRDGREREVFLLVSKEVKDCLLWIKETEKAGRQTKWDYF